jgi:hypothetical protein
MSLESPVLVLRKNGREAIQWIFDLLSQAGLQVMRSFDLHSAGFNSRSIDCPYHDGGPCDCTMAVLLVYENGCPPISLVALGQAGQTWVSLVGSPSPNMDTEDEGSLAFTIEQILTGKQVTLKQEELGERCS